ncbi:hypothetical protein [Streptomyces sp. JB150]|uniref:hypothetical protein n=1 Tax=Streptomyces sp. JB150 TaxID=2714844 RepID=UPI001407D4FE|nr:hypothetical protein [Streptomyces sp. JB150]QIJ63948.1 hypothetical protein G7Z13_19505 [Streptomyces sp. JB150]
MFPYRLRAPDGGLAQGVRFQQHGHAAHLGQRVLGVVGRDAGQGAVAYGFVLRAGDRRVPGGAGRSGGEQGVPDVGGGRGRGVRVVVQYGRGVGARGRRPAGEAVAQPRVSQAG